MFVGHRYPVSNTSMKGRTSVERGSRLRSRRKNLESLLMWRQKERYHCLVGWDSAVSRRSVHCGSRSHLRRKQQQYSMTVDKYLSSRYVLYERQVFCSIILCLNHSVPSPRWRACQLLVFLLLWYLKPPFNWHGDIPSTRTHKRTMAQTVLSPARAQYAVELEQQCLNKEGMPQMLWVPPSCFSYWKEMRY